MKTVISSLLAGVLALMGCTYFKDNPATAKLAIQYSVAKYGEKLSPDALVERMTNVKRIATSVKSITIDESTTVNLLKDVVLEQVAELNLSPADRVLASGLVDIIAQELKGKIGDGLLKPEDKLIISEVMDWIVEAAELSGAVK